jgi:hypothetical protein
LGGDGRIVGRSIYSGVYLCDPCGREWRPVLAIRLGRAMSNSDMCYSAQVIQMARNLSRQLGIRLDYDEVEKLFFRRLDYPSLNTRRGRLTIGKNGRNLVFALVFQVWEFRDLLPKTLLLRRIDRNQRSIA